MPFSTRSLPTIEDVARKRSAELVFRLRCEYLPGEAPFPGSPEEESWIARRETLILTVLRNGSGWSVERAWTRGESTTSHQEDREPAGLDDWSSRLEALGAWNLADLASLDAGEGQAQFGFEAYAYRDDAPDSLDLESWSEPRRWRIERSRAGLDPGPTRRFLAAWSTVLGDDFRASSALAFAFE